MHFSVMALDIGFGRTKIAVRYPKESDMFTDGFPSLAPRNVSGTLSTNVPNPAVNRTYIVNVNNVDFAVGPDVKFSLGGATGSGRTLTDDFPMSVNYEALFLGALAHVDATEIELLVMGLPVHTMDKYKKHLVTKFTGTFTVGARDVTIKKILILPQPLGAMLHYGSIIDYSLNDGETRLIIDCGYVTTDWVVASGYRIIESRSNGIPTGVSAILSAVADLISKAEGTKFVNIERIDECLMNGKDLRIFKNNLSAEKLKNYVKNSHYIVDDCIKTISARVGDSTDLKSILVCGGGANYFLPAIQECFPLVEIELLDNSPYCNVRGFLLFGESQLRRLEAA